jgi:hypothetical protein
VFAHQITGDVNQYGIRDVGKALNQGFVAFSAVIRLMAKGDIMEMVNDLFELVLNGTEHFVNGEARCLGSFEEYVTERITVFEKKYEPITGNLLLKACKVRTLLQDSKGDSTVKDCNRLLENLPQFQQKLSSWNALSPVFDAFYKAHVEYEKDKGELLPRIRKRSFRLPRRMKLERASAGPAGLVTRVLAHSRQTFGLSTIRRRRSYRKSMPERISRNRQRRWAG